MVELIANPDDYDGKIVRTMGVAVLEKGGNAIYLSSESAEHRVHVNGIKLAISATVETNDSLAGKWVVVQGRFHRWEQGETTWRGHLDELSLLYAPKDLVEVRE